MKEKDGELDESAQDFKIQDIQRAIKETANGKSAGVDDAPYKFMKYLGPKGRQMLLHIFKGCGEESGFQEIGS